jgi:hypothetical protein
MASIAKREDGQWRARYRDESGREHARHFARKIDAQRWLDEVSSSVVTGHYVDPKTARTTIEKWCATWLEGYQTRRPGTVKMARVHIKLINKEFGSQRLADVRPSMVKAWTARMTAEGSAKSYVYAVYRRFAQIMGDAVQDGIIPRSPCSRKTSPGEARSGPTWPPQSRCGRCMTRCLSTYGQRFSWVPSLACGRPRRALCGHPTSTSCAASSRLRSSGRPSR